MEMTNTDNIRPSRNRSKDPTSRPQPRRAHQNSRPGGNPSTEIKESAPNIAQVIDLFTMSPINPNGNEKDEIIIGELTRDPNKPQDWTKVVVSKIRVQEIAQPDGTIVRTETPVGTPLEISQELLDNSIVKVEEEMAILRKAQKFGNPEYIKQQAIRERMLDVYRYASGAS